MTAEPEPRLQPDVERPTHTPAIEPLPIQSRASVDYLLRTTQQNLVQLSTMADQKANIIIGSSLLMITIIVGVASSTGMTASLATLGVTASGSAITALLAVMPGRARPRVDEEPNPLYYSEAAAMSPTAHREAVGRLLSDDASLYALIARDIREHAAVLERHKFRYLRIAYVGFVVGLAMTAIVVLIEWSTGAL